MAYYVKFEVYIPTEYHDSAGERRVLDTELVRQLTEEITAKYHGLTESSPIQSPPYRGLWADKAQITIDHLISVFTLVPQDDFEDALKFFERWKSRLEEALHQQFVLIVHSPIQTIGQL